LRAALLYGVHLRSIEKEDVVARLLDAGRMPRSKPGTGHDTLVFIDTNVEGGKAR